MPSRPPQRGIECARGILNGEVLRDGDCGVGFKERCAIHIELSTGPWEMHSYTSDAIVTTKMKGCLIAECKATNLKTQFSRQTQKRRVRLVALEARMTNQWR